MNTDFFDETNELDSSLKELILGVLELAAKHLKLKANAECSVTIVSAERIHEINRDYRHIDRVTDVISFALDDTLEEEGPIIVDDSITDYPHHYGDIIICLERAKEQAEAYGHSIERELGFLACHGFLHLMGYDHQTEEEEKVMFGLQRVILDEYGLKK
ncbi:rRNA maturation RNase YbeY [Atopobacter sp. AH10]|uniref:rRNA maturation RNase YbeY n=1 Tax=Atopobacter sp. AH10 TaxID=2315861 RepID=UPI000EF1EA69|nr:rRNA maturation RNase YbeY [Atopobacter sp. AH10]RLK62495.1 rRNA maturation RNase YbeY [Atopobacter sp. AH10]